MVIQYWKIFSTSQNSSMSNEGAISTLALIQISEYETLQVNFKLVLLEH